MNIKKTRQFCLVFLWKLFKIRSKNAFKIQFKYKKIFKNQHFGYNYRVHVFK